MKRTLLALAFVSPALLNAQTSIVGRWDITSTGAEQPMPSWLEVVPSGNG